jgi:hypothetical protein
MDSLYMPRCSNSVEMADGEDIQPLVCDNGTGMVKVSPSPPYLVQPLSPFFPDTPLIMSIYLSSRLVLLAMMHQGLSSLASSVVLVTLVSW